MANSILTNTAASSAQRFVSQAGMASASSISKLSSGSRIVKASDDAASLAISNKLRADIATLNQASSNASQGSSLLQVANGGLSQIGDLLTRMKTLSTQVVNGTLSSSERQFAQQEFSQMITQIGETASQTQMNGIAMLNGGDKILSETVKGAAVTGNIGASTTTLAATGTTRFTIAGASITGAVSGEVKAVRTEALGGQIKMQIDIGNQTFEGIVDDGAVATTEIEFRDVNNSESGFTMVTTTAPLTNAAATKTDLETAFNLSNGAAANVSFSSNAAEQNTAAALINSGAATFAAAIDASGATKDQTYTLTTKFTAADATTGTTEKLEYQLTGEDGNVYTATLEDQDTGNANSLLAAGTSSTLKFSNGIELTVDATASAAAAVNSIGSATARGVQFEVNAGNSTSLDFQVGVKSTDLISINFDSMSTASLGVAGLNIESVAAGQAASNAIDLAINKVNTSVAQVGALQSRMEYVQSNLATVTENVTAANGVFKDVDMAKEMTEFTKNQALMQAGVSMLSQANQTPQLLLRLIG